MTKLRRYLKRDIDSNKSNSFDTGIMPWVLIVVISFLMMLLINYLSGSLDGIKPLFR